MAIGAARSTPFHLSRRQVFYLLRGPWCVIGYLSISNVDMTPQAVVFDCSPGYGKTFSYLPVPQLMIRPLAVAQPVLAFPLRNLIKAAAADFNRMAVVRLNWATLTFGVLFPFRASNSGNPRADFLFFTCLNAALQVLLLFSILLFVRHKRRVA